MLSALPNESRLSCGAPKKDSFHNLRAPPASSACQTAQRTPGSFKPLLGSSLTVDVPTSYTYDFWARYSEFARQLAQRAKVDMRTLDRGLWKYSEMRQRAA